MTGNRVRSAALLVATAFSLLACNTLSQDQIIRLNEMQPATTLALPDPSQPGEYTPASLLYGSPHHPRRWEYDDREITTSPVDLSAFFHPDPKVRATFIDPGAYYDRVSYDHWGFTEESVPVNGKIWYPADGEGPFPLIVIIHGNHDPYDASEFGYDYLGELSASRGVIFASLDQNMINGRTDGRENDARAFLLLEHIRQILSWSADPATPFYNRIDSDRIGLIGHSRGGEAVVLAAIYNRLDRAPENGSIELDYHFPIMGIVSIAPVEGQYRVAQRELGPGDTNYLVLHGSADGDVSVDMGLRFFHRYQSQFRNTYHSFWIYGANHAQFNTDWARNQDPFPVWGSDLLSLADQQQITKTLISAFFEFSFGREPAYEAFLKDHRQGLHWLPDAFMISNYRSGTGQIVADYEEDVDLETCVRPGWRARSEGLRSWGEQVLALDSNKSMYERRPSTRKNLGYSQQNHAVRLQWDDYGGVYRLETETTLLRGSTLALEVSGLELSEDEILDFSIRIEGSTRRMETSFREHYALPGVPATHVLTRGYSAPEIMQYVEIPLGPVGKDGIRSIEFVFDQIESGTVLIDNITVTTEAE